MFSRNCAQRVGDFLDRFSNLTLLYTIGNPNECLRVLLKKIA